LGLDGDDAYEFMQAFSERFSVDLSAFPYNKYFGPEGNALLPLMIIMAIIRRLTTGMWSASAPLTLLQLAEAAEKRSWADDGLPPKI
jgi:hypothetical protein